MRYTFIVAHTDEFHVTTMCRVLQVKRAGYYAWVNRPPSARVLDDAQLAETIKEIHDTSRRTYGSPRVHEELKAQGQQHGEKRVARIMQEEGLRAKAPRRFRVTTDSNHAHPIAPNVLDRQFAGGGRGRARSRVGGRHHVPRDARRVVVLGDRA
jgi:putative transposase